MCLKSSKIILKLLDTLLNREYNEYTINCDIGHVIIIRESQRARPWLEVAYSGFDCTT